MTATYNPIASSVISSPTSTVTFSSIPATYQDLVLRISSRTGTSGTNGWLQFRFNSSSSGYYENYIYLNVSTNSGGRVGPQSYFGASGWIVTVAGGMTADTFGITEVYIPKYLATTSKSVYALSAADATANGKLSSVSGIWTGTNAITSIEVTPSAALQAGSSLYLYGIASS